MANEEGLRAESVRLFPNWSDAQRARWVAAKLFAQRCPPVYARLMPLVPSLTERVYMRSFAPRTMREATS